MTNIQTDSDIKALERVMKAFANKRRIAIIQLLKHEHELAVTDIARRIRLSVKATSKHLGLLSNLGIVEKEQRSLLVFYRISRDVPSHAQAILTLL